MFDLVDKKGHKDEQKELMQAFAITHLRGTFNQSELLNNSSRRKRAQESHDVLHGTNESSVESRGG